MEEKEVEIVKLEDKLEYAIVDTIEIAEIKYVYLGLLEELEKESTKHPTVVIRKLDKKEKNILGLDTEEEYKVALEAFVKKHKENENS